MDVVVLSGLALVGTMLAAMTGLIHAEVRYTRRSLRSRPPYQPQARSHAPMSGAGARWTHTHAHGHAGPHGQQRPHTHTPPMRQECAHGNPWAPFFIQPGAGHDDLKRQYRALARAHHPDHGGDPQTMARINLLYAQLVDGR